jgi:hypothetical protein
MPPLRKEKKTVGVKVVVAFMLRLDCQLTNLQQKPIPFRFERTRLMIELSVFVENTCRAFE